MTVIKLVVAGVLFMGSWVLMGVAPHVAGLEALIFFAGILAMALAFALPVHVFSRSA